jgi:hypothetical protein
MFRNIMLFYGEALLAPRPTPKLEGHPFSGVRDCLFNIFTATLHNWRPFLHPQPEHAPYRGDRDPLNPRHSLYKRIFLELWSVQNLEIQVQACSRD